MESAILAQDLSECSDVILSDSLRLCRLVTAVDDSVKVLNMLLEGLGHPHELVLSDLDIAVDLRIPVSLKQLLEAECRARDLDLSLDGEPIHIGADLNIHVSRLNDALELKFPSSRPLEHEGLLMLIGVFKEGQQ